MLEIFVIPEAINDTQKIFEYISEELKNTKAADNLIEEINKAILRAAEFPQSAPKVKAVHNKDIRKVIVKNFVFYYYVRDKKLYIIRVSYAKRDLENLPLQPPN